jgi:hypothetical protein
MIKARQHRIWMRGNLILTVLALLLIVVVSYITIRPRTYASHVDKYTELNVVSFGSESGWSFEVDKAGLTLHAADSNYFLFEGASQEFGEPGPPPTDYDYDTYYSLTQELPKGKWEIKEGTSPSLDFSSEESVYTVYATINFSHAIGEIFIIVFFIAMIWGMLMFFWRIVQD